MLHLRDHEDRLHYYNNGSYAVALVKLSIYSNIAFRPNCQITTNYLKTKFDRLFSNLVLQSTKTFSAIEK